MKPKFLFAAGFLLLLMTTLPLFRSRPSSVDWHTDLEAAIAEARSDDKLLLTFLYTDWCGYCKQMDQVTFTDATVVDELSGDFVWLRLNAERDAAGISLNRRFRVSGFPTVLILDTEKNEINRLQGFMPPDRFRRAAQDSIRGTATPNASL